MCGIVALMGHRADEEAARVVRQMAALLQHRGPDDHGFYADAEHGVWLGFQRLSIVDLSPNGHQPMVNEDGTCCLVANGEIYNAPALRVELETLGHRFRSHSDSEVILHAYEAWGPECVQRLEGMFAWVLWDERARRLVFARDRLGIKPLYYLELPGGGLAIASEAKAFLALRGQGWVPALNEAWLPAWLHFPFLPDAEATMLDGVKKLPPATCAVWSNETLSLRRYWRLGEASSSVRSPDEAVERLRGLLTDTVRSHLMSDVPVAVLLSGGLDSSTLLAALRKANPSYPVRALTIGFDDPKDERPFARSVARHLGVVHEEIVLNHAMLIERFDEGVWTLDDLSSPDGGVWSTMLAAEALQQRGIKVVLVGEGADELFGGYHLFKLAQRPWRWFPTACRSWAYYYLTTGVGGGSLLRYSRFYRSAFHGGASFDGISAYELEQQLPNHLLMKVDKATMAHGVEARVPYLDHRLVEFVYGLPAEYKLQGSWYSRAHGGIKWLLREVARPWLPPEITQRKKQGFLLPFLWKEPAFLDKLRDTLSDPQGMAHAYLTRREIRRIIDEPFRHRFAAWRWLILSIWEQQYLGGQQPVTPIPVEPIAQVAE